MTVRSARYSASVPSGAPASSRCWLSASPPVTRSAWASRTTPTIAPTAAARTSGGIAASRSWTTSSATINRLYPTPNAPSAAPNTITGMTASRWGAAGAITRYTGAVPMINQPTAMALAHAARVATIRRTVVERATSSNTNTAPPIGALNAIARPAPATAA